MLSNLLLDELDKELEKRGHRFCRYADDCNIYVGSRAAGERVMVSVTRFLEGKLKLRVNRDKSAVAPVWKRKFLGHRLLGGGVLGIAPKSIERFKDKVRMITRRSRGVKLSRVIEDLNTLTRGWVSYFRHASAKGHLQRLDEWIRRKLRCYRLKQCIRASDIGRFLREQGVSHDEAWKLAGSGKGWWHLSRTPAASWAMPIAWLETQGLQSMSKRYLELQLDGNRRMR